MSIGLTSASIQRTELPDRVRDNWQERDFLAPGEVAP
jgi:hypothetical protein